MKLVIARDNFGKPRARLTKPGEMAQQVEEAALLKHAVDKRRKLWRALGYNDFTIRRAPRHETFEICRQRANARTNAV